ncbi:hypothetical protein ACHHYP_07813 [Achlya hypogyna]|uniref:Uncharacterized protein n=1 Tax=Achlya hypogyna TaxID=1202772 RepID=A0A1V9YQE2_ACHHY|nr:hypothetical protein ACHHYP_07813 [Achlya hypogyna]
MLYWGSRTLRKIFHLERSTRSVSLRPSFHSDDVQLLKAACVEISSVIERRSLELLFHDEEHPDTELQKVTSDFLAQFTDVHRPSVVGLSPQPAPSGAIPKAPDVDALAAVSSWALNPFESSVTEGEITLTEPEALNVHRKPVLLMYERAVSDQLFKALGVDVLHSPFKISLDEWVGGKLASDTAQSQLAAFAKASDRGDHGDPALALVARHVCATVLFELSSIYPVPLSVDAVVGQSHFAAFHPSVRSYVDARHRYVAAPGVDSDLFAPAAHSLPAVYGDVTTVAATPTPLLQVLSPPLPRHQHHHDAMLQVPSP